MLWRWWSLGLLAVRCVLIWGSRVPRCKKWITDARLQAQGMQPSADPVAAKEISQALKRIRELEMENEVLRAAAAYLSQEAIRPKGSSRPWKS